MNRTPKHNLKEKKCKHCGAPFLPRRPLQSLCSPLCAITVVKEVTEKTRKREQEKREKRLRAENREAKERLKTHSDHAAALQKEVNTIVRLIDLKCPCVSSGRTTGKMNAGHRLSRGAWPEIRFHLFNIWLQTEKDNTYNHGNIEGYDKGILAIGGVGLLDYCRDLPTVYKGHKPSSKEMIDATVTARQIIRELESRNKVDSLPRSPEDRIRWRNEVNQRLKIYL